MTANQIAAQSERELERHNVNVEDETERHNKAMETLTEDANNITRAHNEQMASLQKWYNEAYIDYLNAAEEDKVALESELNDIKAMQAEADKTYKQQMTAIESTKADSDKQYKQAMGETAYMSAGLQAKRLEYEKHQWDTENYLKFQEYGIRHEELLETQKWHEQNYLLGIREANIKTTNNYLRLQELEWQKEFQNRSLNLSESMLPFQQAESKAKTSYMNSDKILNYGKTIDLFNPFKLNPGAANAVKGLIDLF